MSYMYRRSLNMRNASRASTGFRAVTRTVVDLHPESMLRAENSSAAQDTRFDAAISVFSRRHAIVIGPTPPGTGVMEPATSAASA